MTKTLYDQAMGMYQRQQFAELRAFKKAKKKSWTALGINAEMEALIMAPINVEGTVTGRLSKEEKPKPLTYPQQRFVAADISVLKYTPREIHALKGTNSHPTMALYASVLEQEKFRADPRFPLMQIMQRVKRYKAIFAGKPYQPIFA